MNKNILIVSSCAMLLSISTIAHSAEGPYVSGNLGIAIPIDFDATDSTGTSNIESDNGLAIGVAAGYDFGNNMRAEGEIAYQKNDLAKATAGGVSNNITGDMSSLALLLNGYYDFKNESSLTPFISAGLGAVKVETNDTTNDDNDTVFAYQFSAGAGYALSEKVTLDVKYRYLRAAEADLGGSTIEGYSSHNLYAGVRVAF